MVEAINVGDFSIVSKFLYPDSPLYESQGKLVDRLYNGQITESVVDYRVEDVQHISDECLQVVTYEAIDVHRPEATKSTAYNWTYKLKWHDQANRYLLYSIE